MSTFSRSSIPKPYNEPMLNYEVGSAQRKLLKEACAKLRNTSIEVPCVVGGKEIRTGDIQKQLICSDHTKVLCTFHQANTQVLQQAIDSALEAKAKWETLPFEDRAAIFLKTADLLNTKYRYDILAATMLGQGKTVWQAEIDAAAETIDFLRFNPKYAEEIYSQQPPANSVGTWNRVEYRPLEGYVVAISPFNFTAIGANLPSSPALMGNVVLWKPASTAILSNYIVFKAFREAGLPDGVIQFIPGAGRVVGDYLLDNKHFAGLHFTGSTGVFNGIYKKTADNLVKGLYRGYPRIVGETGGKDFHFLHNSGDVDHFVFNTLRASFEYQGQKCSACSRAYIPASLWPEIKEKLIAGVKQMKLGQSDDFSVFVSAVIDKNSFNNIQSYIEHAKANPNDAEIIVGGKCDSSVGWFVEPTIIHAKDPHYKSMEEEIFGPVLTLYVYEDDKYEETLRLCDSTSPYALTGAIFAKCRYAINQASTLLRNSAGNFYINDKCTGAVVGQQPFGGARASGTNDKAGASLNLLRWVSARTIKENFVPLTGFTYPYMQEENRFDTGECVDIQIPIAACPDSTLPQTNEYDQRYIQTDVIGFYLFREKLVPYFETKIEYESYSFLQYSYPSQIENSGWAKWKMLLERYQDLVNDLSSKVLNVQNPQLAIIESILAANPHLEVEDYNKLLIESRDMIQTSELVANGCLQMMPLNQPNFHTQSIINKNGTVAREWILELETHAGNLKSQLTRNHRTLCDILVKYRDLIFSNKQEFSPSVQILLESYLHHSSMHMFLLTLVEEAIVLNHHTLDQRVSDYYQIQRAQNIILFEQLFSNIEEVKSKLLPLYQDTGKYSVYTSDQDAMNCQYLVFSFMSKSFSRIKSTSTNLEESLVQFKNRISIPDIGKCRFYREKAKKFLLDVYPTKTTTHMLVDDNSFRSKIEYFDNGPSNTDFMSSFVNSNDVDGLVKIDPLLGPYLEIKGQSPYHPAINYTSTDNFWDGLQNMTCPSKDSFAKSNQQQQQSQNLSSFSTTDSTNNSSPCIMPTCYLWFDTDKVCIDPENHLFYRVAGICEFCKNLEVFDGMTWDHGKIGFDPICPVKCLKGGMVKDRLWNCFSGIVTCVPALPGFYSPPSNNSMYPCDPIPDHLGYITNAETQNGCHSATRNQIMVINKHPNRTPKLYNPLDILKVGHTLEFQFALTSLPSNTTQKASVGLFGIRSSWEVSLLYTNNSNSFSLAITEPLSGKVLVNTNSSIPVQQIFNRYNSVSLVIESNSIISFYLSGKLLKRVTSFSLSIFSTVQSDFYIGGHIFQRFDMRFVSFKAYATPLLPLSELGYTLANSYDSQFCPQKCVNGDCLVCPADSGFILDSNTCSCTCPSGMEIIGGKCLVKCPTNSTRQSDNLCLCLDGFYLPAGSQSCQQCSTSSIYSPVSYPPRTSSDDCKCQGDYSVSNGPHGPVCNAPLGNITCSHDGDISINEQVGCWIEDQTSGTYVLRYTTDGTDPTPISNIFHNFTATVLGPLGIKIKGFGQISKPSPIKVLQNNVVGLMNCTVSPQPNKTYNTAITIILSCLFVPLPQSYKPSFSNNGGFNQTYNTETGVKMEQTDDVKYNNIIFYLELPRYPYFYGSYNYTILPKVESPIINNNRPNWETVYNRETVEIISPTKYETNDNYIIKYKILTSTDDLEQPPVTCETGTIYKLGEKIPVYCSSPVRGCNVNFQAIGCLNTGYSEVANFLSVIKFNETELVPIINPFTDPNNSDVIKVNITTSFIFPNLRMTTRYVIDKSLVSDDSLLNKDYVGEVSSIFQNSLSLPKGFVYYVYSRNFINYNGQVYKSPQSVRKIVFDGKKANIPIIVDRINETMSFIVDNINEKVTISFQSKNPNGIIRGEIDNGKADLNSPIITDNKMLISMNCRGCYYQFFKLSIIDCPKDIECSDTVDVDVVIKMRIQKPIISHLSGHYVREFIVYVTCPETIAEVYYSTNPRDYPNNLITFGPDTPYTVSNGEHSLVFACKNFILGISDAVVVRYTVDSRPRPEIIISSSSLKQTDLVEMKCESGWDVFYKIEDENDKKVNSILPPPKDSSHPTYSIWYESKFSISFTGPLEISVVCIKSNDHQEISLPRSVTVRVFSEKVLELPKITTPGNENHDLNNVTLKSINIKTECSGYYLESKCLVVSGKSIDTTPTPQFSDFTHCNNEITIEKNSKIFAICYGQYYSNPSEIVSKSINFFVNTIDDVDGNNPTGVEDDGRLKSKNNLVYLSLLSLLAIPVIYFKQDSGTDQ
eukprot:gene792-984_t